MKEHFKKLIVAIMTLTMLLGGFVIMTGCNSSDYIFCQNDFELTIAITINGQKRQHGETIVVRLSDTVIVTARFYNLSGSDLHIRQRGVRFEDFAFILEGNCINGEFGFTDGGLTAGFRRVPYRNTILNSGAIYTKSSDLYPLVLPTTFNARASISFQIRNRERTQVSLQNELTLIIIEGENYYGS